jgi:hypothetical protein
MKKTVLLGLIISLIIGSCTQEEKSPLEGAWKMIYAQNRTMEETYPAQYQGDQIKMWSKEYFTFVGHFEMDTLSQESYGWGTYTLNGSEYEENIKLHVSQSSIGQTVKMLIEIQNDTLIQKWPADENWVLADEFSTEIYVRVK